MSQSIFDTTYIGSAASQVKETRADGDNAQKGAKEAKGEKKGWGMGI
jgi:hypothetical protein